MTGPEISPRRSTRAERHPLNRVTVGQRFAVLTAQGGALLAVAAVAGGHGLLAGASFAGFAALALVGLVPGELSGVRRADADERQRRMQHEAIAWSGYLIRPVVVIGAAIELYRGTPGPFVLIAVLGSLAEIGAVLLLPRLR